MVQLKRDQTKDLREEILKTNNYQWIEAYNKGRKLKAKIDETTYIQPIFEYVRAVEKRGWKHCTKNDFLRPTDHIHAIAGAYIVLAGKHKQEAEVIQQIQRSLEYKPARTLIDFIDVGEQLFGLPHSLNNILTNYESHNMRLAETLNNTTANNTSYKHYVTQQHIAHKLMNNGTYGDAKITQQQYKQKFYSTQKYSIPKKLTEHYNSEQRVLSEILKNNPQAAHLKTEIDTAIKFLIGKQAKDPRGNPAQTTIQF